VLVEAVVLARLSFNKYKYLNDYYNMPHSNKWNKNVDLSRLLGEYLGVETVLTACIAPDMGRLALLLGDLRLHPAAVKIHRLG